MRTIYKNTLYRISIVVILVMTAMESHAQVYLEPYPEIGGMIDNHKAVSTALFARVVIQDLRELAHDDLKVTIVDFQKIEKAMDKAEKAFNVLDALIHSGVTFIKLTETAQNIKKTCEGTKTLIEWYVDGCLKRKSIVKGDTIFISSGKKMIEVIATGVNEITDMIGITSPGGLIEIVFSGAFTCSTDEFISILNDIYENCENIDKTLRSEYFKLWEYMMLRMGYWKDLPDPRKSTTELARNSIERWLRSAGSNKQVDYYYKK